MTHSRHSTLRSPLTILQLVPALESGGVERGTLEVAAELVRRGQRSLVVSAGGRLVSELEAGGTEHTAWDIGKKSPAALRWVAPLRSLLRRERVDIVHARSRVPAWLGWLAWKSLPQDKRPRFLTTAHGLYSVNAYSAVMTRGERVIAISRTVENHLRQHFPKLPPELIRLIYRGVDPGEFPHGHRPSGEWLERWYGQYPHLAGQPVITLPGRLTRYKGHPDFLRLVAGLRRVVPSIQALIVGGEDPQRRNYAHKVRSLVRELGLQKHVTFTGHRSDIREIYAVSNVVVSVSSNPPEAFGRTALEALSLGVPVVGYDHSGVGEILQAVFPQGAVSAGDLPAMHAKVLHVLQHGATVPSNNQFTRKAMLDRTLDVYEELAA
jgi:glycosyltransferase involved in cell wall biosynthesis